MIRMVSLNLLTRVAAIGTLVVPAVAATPFASRVVSFEPAPGQFVNNPAFNDPNASLGAPVGGGTQTPNNSSIVSLGGFGGELILGFDSPVADGYHNRRCLDAIVFGNAYFISADPYRRWAEAGVIEISIDANQNGLADDDWYLLPGSHLNIPADQPISMTWDDTTTDPTYPPQNAAWIPSSRTGLWTTLGYPLPTLFDGPVIINPLGFGVSEEGTWGYADHAPTLILGDLDGDNLIEDGSVTAEEFYTIPDDPFLVGISAGSGGGDAFDIAAALDPTTGQPAGLTHFDFIRIKTGVDAINFALGEISTEIDAVSAVAAGPFGDSDWDEDVDSADWQQWLSCFTGPAVLGELDCACRMIDWDMNATVDVSDIAIGQRAFGE